MTVREWFRVMRAEQFRSNLERLLRIHEVLDTEVFKRREYVWGGWNVEELSHGDLLYAFRDVVELLRAEKQLHNATLARALDLEALVWCYQVCLRNDYLTVPTRP
jgi:hypothetical protein